MPDSRQIRQHQRLERLALACVITALGITGLVVGKALLVPLAAAAMISFLIHGFAQRIGRVTIGGYRLPPLMSSMTAMAAILVVGSFLLQFVAANIAAVQEAAPGYEANFRELCNLVLEHFGLEEAALDTGVDGTVLGGNAALDSGAALEGRVPVGSGVAFDGSAKGVVDDPVGEVSLSNENVIGRYFNSALERLDLGRLVTGLVAALSGFAAQTGVILLYVVFLMFERRFFVSKVNALFPGDEDQRESHDLIRQMVERIQTYIWVKTLLSLLTAVVSYGIMRAVGVDYSEFWALLIFLLNYIPTLGSMVAVAFPTLLVAVQFVSWGPFLSVLVGLGATQFLIGNVLEPRVLGTTLNLSPLAILLALALWGAMWGIVGMFLCVPLTMIAAIIFAHFEPTRPIAILLSVDGQIE